MVTALVTGGTGFVGSFIARALLEAGHTVRVLRRPSSRLDLIADLPVEHAIGDIMDYDSLERAMRGCTWVFHTAAVADYWRAQRIRLYLVNVHGTRNVFDAAQLAGVGRVIFTSSAAAVGLRSDGKSSDETMAFNLQPGRFPYGHSKALGEHEALRAVARGQDIVTLNPTIILGPGDINQISSSNIVEFARGLVPPFYPPGSVTLIDVRDVARAHVAAAEKGRSGERYLLGAEDMTLREMWGTMARVVGARPPQLRLPKVVMPILAELIQVARRVGIKLPIDADQVRLSALNLLFESTKARQELAIPQISMAQSIEDAYRWYVDTGVISV